MVSSYGNQKLLPQFTNSIELNYTRKLEKGTVTGGVFYRAISNEINRALYVDKSNIKIGKVILTHDNFDDTSAYGVELSSNYKPTKWWSFNGSFDLFSQTQKGIAEYINVPLEQATEANIVRNTNIVDNVSWNFRMYNSFSASKRLTFTAFMFYRGKNKNLQFDMLPMYFMNLGARLSVLKGKGQSIWVITMCLIPCDFDLAQISPFCLVVSLIGKAVPSSLALITALEVAITALSQEGSVKMMRKVAEAVFFSTSRRRQFLVHNPTCQPA